MSEEEIIKILQEIIQKNQQVIKEAYKNKDINTMQLVADIDNEAIAIQGLLDLYQTEKIGNANLQILLDEEKEKNKELQKYMKEYLIPKSTINLVYISKDKIKEKMDWLYKDGRSYFLETSDMLRCHGILQELLEERN